MYTGTTPTHPAVHQSLETTHKYFVMNESLITVAAELLRKHRRTNHRLCAAFSANVVLNINLTHFESSIPVRSQLRQLVECNVKPWNCTSWPRTEACWEGLQIPFTPYLSTGGSPLWSLNYCSPVRPSMRDGFGKIVSCCILSLI